MVDAGLRDLKVATHAFDRLAPLSTREFDFVAYELAELQTRVVDYLDPAHRILFDHLVDPSSSVYLPAQPSFTMTCIERLVVGVRP